MDIEGEHVKSFPTFLYYTTDITIMKSGITFQKGIQSRIREEFFKKE